MYVIGVDPGLTGAVASLDSHGGIQLIADPPVSSDKSLSWINGAHLRGVLVDALAFAEIGEEVRIYIERVSAMPKQGVASSFKFGMAFGSVIAALQTLRYPIEFVTASKWKRWYGLPADKQAALDKARLLFPQAPLERKKDHGRAEALLIAHWAQTVFHRNPAP